MIVAGFALAVGQSTGLQVTGTLRCVAGGPASIMVDGATVTLAVGGGAITVAGSPAGVMPLYSVADPVASVAQPVPPCAVAPYSAANVTLRKLYAPSLNVAVASPPPEIDRPTGFVEVPPRTVVVAMTSGSPATFEVDQ